MHNELMDQKLEELYNVKKRYSNIDLEIHNGAIWLIWDLPIDILYSVQNDLWTVVESSLVRNVSESFRTLEGAITRGIEIYQNYILQEQSIIDSIKN